MGTRADEARAGGAETEEPQFLDPEDVDESYVPRRFDDLVTVEVDGEQIVVGGLWGQAQLLNPTAGLMWQFFDGQASLAELIDDFAEATETPREIVAADVLEFAKQVAYGGFFADVMETFEELEFGEPAVEIEEGTELDAFSATDLDGRDRALLDFRGRGVYLVNWSPGCGYCDTIAETLGTLEAPLATAGYDLVFVASGSEEANRKLVDRAGLEAPVLFPKEDARPFGGLGTPAAVVLDEHGVVTGSLAMGAFDVPKRAAQLAGVELPEPAADAASPSAGMCGPGASASGPKTTWLGVRAFELDGAKFAIRYNNEWSAGVLDGLLAGLGTDEAVGDLYGIALTDPARPSRELELLVQGTQQLVRSRSRKRVLVGLLNHLSGILVEPDPSLLKLHSSAAVDRQGRAVLLPVGLAPMIGKLQPRLAKLGLSLVDAEFAFVDPATAELVVLEPSLPFDASVLEEVDAGVALGRTELPLVAWGRYPIDDWYVFAFDSEDGSWVTDGSETVRPALAVASTVNQCLGDVPSVVEKLPALVERVPVRPIFYETAAELTSALERR